MKLFYHFLVLVAASLVMVACASMFASTPEEISGQSTQTGGNNLNNRTVIPAVSNTQLIFSDLDHYDFSNRYDRESRNTESGKNKLHENLRTAADYTRFSIKNK
ncbi:hypothetical protein LX99_01213 [Mucilaginibacter oryzae]|uniref:RxLR effector protein n=1 Tax=Mucilaginibacter oryzae TaxID=468058 RepID=A0A316HFD7_9SPHI|nr:hypothetical protein [Mucilaginibacter oryzae]PWK78761.1 hypothetical protein LX99_01213 [Mucilaginibacter oryzae]